MFQYYRLEPHCGQYLPELLLNILPQSPHRIAFDGGGRAIAVGLMELD
jgi:hypothetical protein